MPSDAPPASLGAPHAVARGDSTPRPRVIMALVVLVSIAMPWIASWNHPLHAPDEGRYGTVSAAMAESGEWLVPRFRGMPHLTKPPLIYWLEAASIRALGRHEFALRLPSLAAGSLTL